MEYKNLTVPLLSPPRHVNRIRSAAERITVHAVQMAFALILFFLCSAKPALAEFVDPNSCGGIDQRTCELSSARKVGDVYVPKPHPDAFVDIGRDEWWRCPDSHPNRTIHAVNGATACETDVALVSDATQGFRDPNGKLYKCPSSYPNRTVHSVTGTQACERNAPGGAFKDANGNVYRCAWPYTSRTIFPVTGSQACERSAPSGAFKDPNGKMYRCNSPHTKRTIFSVTGSKACERGIPQHAFSDGGTIYTCDGWRRTIFSVTSDKACETGIFLGVRRKEARVLGSLWSSAENLGSNYSRAENLGSSFSRATEIGQVNAPAIFISKRTNPKPLNAFADPRLDLDANPLNLDNDEYWECPVGFWRNLEPVTHSAACTVDIGRNCDADNIAVGTPWGGYSCGKRGQCGANGQRPCQIVERIPSCNKGLAEDFVDHKCVDTELAMCLTLTRASWLAREGIKGFTEFMEQLEEPMNVVIEGIINTIPPDVRAELEKGGDLVYQTTIKPIENQVTGAMSSVLKGFQDTTGPLAQLSKLAGNQPDANALADILTDTNTCHSLATGNTTELRNKLQSVLGLDLSNLGDVAMNDMPYKSWGQRGLEIVFPSAYAHDESFNNDKMHAYGIVGLNVQIVLGRTGGAGLSFDTYLIFDHHNIGWGWDIGGVVAFNAPVAQMTGFAGTKWSTGWDKLQNGITTQLALQVPVYVGKKLGDDNGLKDVELGIGFRTDETDYLSTDPKDPKFWASLLDSVVLGFSFETEETTSNRMFTPLDKDDPATKKSKRRKIGLDHLGGKADDALPEIVIGGGYEWIVLGTNVTGGANMPSPGSAVGETVKVKTGFLRAAHSNKCLDGNDGKTNGANVHQWDCHGGDNQKVSLKPVAGKKDVYALAFPSNQCVDVTAASTQNGANIQLWECVDVPQQQFKMESVEAGKYRLISVKSNKALEVVEDSIVNGGNIQQNSQDDGVNQHWYLDEKVKTE